MKVYRVSITLWLAFEWGGKSLKRPGLDDWDAKSALTGWKAKELVSGVQRMGIRTGKRRNLSRESAEAGRGNSQNPTRQNRVWGTCMQNSRSFQGAKGVPPIDF